MNSVSFPIPTRIILGKNKKRSFPINVNTFANQHHRVKHNAKMVFYDYIKSLDLKHKTRGPYAQKVRLHYEYYAERNGDFDEANVGGGLDKFLCDALVNVGVLIDDNHRYVKHYTFEFKGIEREYDWDRDDLKGVCYVSIIPL